MGLFGWYAMIQIRKYSNLKTFSNRVLPFEQNGGLYCAIHRTRNDGILFFAPMLEALYDTILLKNMDIFTRRFRIESSD